MSAATIFGIVLLFAALIAGILAGAIVKLRQIQDEAAFSKAVATASEEATRRLQLKHKEFRRGFQATQPLSGSESAAFTTGFETAASAQRVRKIATIVAAVLAVAGFIFVILGPIQQANGDQDGSSAVTEAESSEESPEDDAKAKAELDYYLVETVNAIQVKQVLGEGDVTTSPEVHQDYVTKVTGYEDGFTTPYSSKSLDEGAARAETQGAIFDESTRKGNVHAAYGYVSAILYIVGDDVLADMPELQRLMSAYSAQGIEAFYETENDQFKVSKSDDSFFYNEDGKLLLAIGYALFSDGHLKFYGVEHHQTRVNWHSNAAMVDSDRRIELNPIQYEGDFYVWGYEWKGYEFEHFGTNCGAANGLGCGDKRPALFCYPEPETSTDSNPGTGGGTPPTDNGGTPPTDNGGTPPTDGGDKPKPPTDDQGIKVPEEGSAPSGNAPVGGGKGHGTTPLEDDHRATSTGASSDARNDDGTSDSSNRIQNPSAAQDNSTPPTIPENGITEGATSAHTDDGTNTDSETYTGTADV